MKTSRKLFIGFFSLITLVCLSVLVPSKKDNNENNRANKEIKDQSVAIPHFNHLKVLEGCRLKIRGGNVDKWELVASGLPDSIVYQPKYVLSGDTLILGKNSMADKRIINLWCGKIKTIKSNGSIQIENQQDSLWIESTKGSVAILKKQTASFISIKAKNSKVNCYASMLKAYHLEANHSRCYFDSHHVEEFNATFTNVCNVSLRSALNMHIARDRLSKITVYK